MTLELSRNQELLHMVDPEKGTVDRRVYSDQQIYELELERIFARAWNFMAHDSQIPNAGDFFLTFIGEDRIIVVRDKDGGVQCLVNSCRHRGNAVCRAEEGHATSFMCTYHGWTFDLKGNLVGVPGFKEVYHEDLKREEWGLIKAAKADSYKGFIFATMDPQAPELNDYLGEVGRMSIDMIALRGDMAIIDGIQKYTIGCNWKLAADNVWDFYHANISHASSNMARWTRGGSVARARGLDDNRTNTPFSRPNFVALGEYGHAICGTAYDAETAQQQLVSGLTNEWRDSSEAKAAFGPLTHKIGGHPHIFPNFWVTSTRISLRLPKGPAKTEIWWFIFYDKSMPQDRYKMLLHSAEHVFGPAGMLEQDDGENWDQSTRGAQGVISKRYPLHYAMGNGRDKVIEEEGAPPYAITAVNEHAQLWLYRAWSEWMSAEDWQELRANHSAVPRATI